jgi:hypothetical protein
MSVMVMNLNGWAKKIISAAAVITAIGVMSAYVGSFIPNYALASDLKAHIVSSDNRYAKSIKASLKKEIKVIENAIALYGLDRSSRALTPRESLHETQLINMKAEYLRDLVELSPR